MPDKLVGPSSGLSNFDLAKANAGTGDVIAGKAFYARDKNLKTGSIKNVRDLTSIRLDSENDIPLFYGIDGGFHQKHQWWISILHMVKLRWTKSLHRWNEYLDMFFCRRL